MFQHSDKNNQSQIYIDECQREERHMLLLYFGENQFKVSWFKVSISEDTAYKENAMHQSAPTLDQRNANPSKQLTARQY